MMASLPSRIIVDDSYFETHPIAQVSGTGVKGLDKLRSDEGQTLEALVLESFYGARYYLLC